MWKNKPGQPVRVRSTRLPPEEDTKENKPIQSMQKCFFPARQSLCLVSKNTNMTKRSLLNNWLIGAMASWSPTKIQTSLRLMGQFFFTDSQANKQINFCLYYHWGCSHSLLNPSNKMWWHFASKHFFYLLYLTSDVPRAFIFSCVNDDWSTVYSMNCDRHFHLLNKYDAKVAF